MIHIALKDLYILLKDKKAVLAIIIMPLVLILVLGSALDGTFTTGSKFSKFSIGVVNKDNGNMSKVFVDEVLKNNMKAYFTTNVVSEKEANKALKDEKFPTVIIIPEDFTKNIESDKSVKIEIKSQMDQKFESSVIEGITKSFAKNISISHASAGAAMETYGENGINIANPNAEAGIIISDLQSKLKDKTIKFKEVDQKAEKTISAMQYYSAAMMIMYMLFAVSIGSKKIVEERETRTLERIMCASGSKARLIIGKILGMFVISIVQAIILIAFTSFVYKVDWGKSWAAILLIVVALSFVVAALGIFVAGIVKTAKAADAVSSAIVWGFSIVGGGMIPIYVMPESLKLIGNITINSWAIKAFQDIMSGATLLNILPNCMIIISMGLVYAVVGVLKFKV